ncbi:MAG TPA: carboxylesterase family protein [Candidatus Dietzia intestinipullorum]|nr:carboxylesterase family protein [Candidatus Dietzia intestinipullorum]
MTRPEVALSTGRLHGTDLGGAVRFLGIPYAEDPVGDLRFAAPRPREPWPGTRDATRPAATAQRLRFDPDPAIPEPIVAGTDILHVDVWAPDVGRDHPVLVWFHGGGWESGSSHQPWFDGATFARRGIVVVSVGYRLGVEGFTSFPDAPDNRGVLDWIAALEWVRDEIAVFGGDPRRVTISGQSAGGGAVLALLGSPHVGGLFQRAIAASPAALRGADIPAPKGVTAESLAQGGRGAVDEFHRRLRRDNQLTLPFRPVIGGDLLPVPVLESVAVGDGAQVPLLIGSTATEFETIARSLPGPALLPGATMIAMSQDIPRAGLRALARQSSRRSVRRSVGAVIDAATIHSTVTRAAERRAAVRAPTWVYDFSWDGGSGPVHCADLPFFWGVPGAENVERYLGAPAPHGLVDAMHESWVGFVTEGEPGFPAYEVPDRRVRVWDDPPSVVDDGLAAVREVWLPEGRT